MPLSSSLAAFILYLFAWGSMSPQLVQQLAYRANKDMEEMNRTNASTLGVPADMMESYSEISMLARLGDSGRYSGNCHRDLMEMLPATALRMPQPTRLPLKNNSPMGYEMHDQHIL